VLWCVSCGHLVLGPFVLEKGLYFPGGVFTPSIRAQDLEFVACLKLNLRDKSVQVSSHLRLLLHSVDEDLAGLVIDPCNKVGEALVRAGGEKGADV